ncbi:MAG: DUF2550 family protein [bacterium]
MTRAELFAAVVVLAGVALLLLYVVLIGLRKQQLLGRPGGIPLALRVGAESWALGVGRYVGGELQWYGALRPGRRPTRVLRRGALEVTGQRGRRPAESMLPVGSVVVECLSDGERLSLSLSSAAVTGFLAWLESSAPR